MQILVAATVFVAVTVAVYALLGLGLAEDRRVSRRLRGMSQYEIAQVREAEPILRPFDERVLRPTGRAIVRVAHAVSPADYRDRLRRRLTLAGNPRGMDADRMLAIQFVLGFGTAGLFTAVAFIGRIPAAGWLFVGAPLVAVAFFGPDLWLGSTIHKRQGAIRRALPDMLDMLTISVEAGLGFDAAIAKLVRNSTGPLAREFARMLKEVQSGASRSDALRNLSRRTEVPELNAFIMAIIQADAFGISVSTVLRTQSKEMRLKRRQYAEEMAQKAPVKMVFPLILCILPATIIVVLGPAVISFGQAFGFMD